MSVDNSIQYVKRSSSERAAKAKPRRRERIIREKPQQQSESKRAKHSEPIRMTAQGATSKIAQYTLQGLSVTEMHDQLEQEGFAAPSKILLGNVRQNMRHLISVIIDEGLVQESALERYQRKAKAKRQ